MNISEQFKNNKFLILALIFALFNMGAIFFIFGFQKYGDSSDYFQLIRWFGGEKIEFPVERILRPLGPLIAAPLEFLGEGAGLIVQNAIFYLFSAFLIFKITELIYHNSKVAFLASLFFVTATPVLEVGLAYLTDMGAWFFYLLSLFLTLLYLKNRNDKLITINGFLSGLGVLMKESGGLGALFFGLVMLFSKGSLKEKIFKIMRFAIFFAIPILALQVFTFKYFRITSWDWYLMHGAGQEQEPLFLTLFRYFGQLFRILGVLWIFVFFGLRAELKEKNWQRMKIFLALLPSSFSFFFWEASGGGRAAFIFAPLGILLASYGLKKRGVFFLSLFILVILVLNYWFSSVNREVPFIDIIYTSIFSR